MRLVDDAVLDATEAILSEHGFDGVSLERVAERAERSRVTLWRQGVTKESLITGLLQRLTDDFQQEFWPVLNGSGPARFSASLEACSRSPIATSTCSPYRTSVPLAAQRAPSERLAGFWAVRRRAPSGIGGRDPDAQGDRGHRRRRVQHRVLGLRAFVIGIGGRVNALVRNRGPPDRRVGIPKP